VFTDDLSTASAVCLYRGGWSSECGHNQLGATWLSDGQNVVAAITTDPVAFFHATVDSPTSATLTEWATNIEFSDAQPLSGSLSFSDTAFLISPAAPPFSIDGCNFDLYTGAFGGMQSQSGG